jgi:oligopeptide/dipeptide ABC transporter ATP-binding protein
MSAETTPALSVRDLHASFRTRSGTVRAVRGVTFDVAPGERLGLVGESGSGKSALALAIAGLLEPPGYVDSGEIWLAGRNLTLLPERELRQTRGKSVGVVFQDALAGLDPVKTIGNQIGESLRAHDSSISRRDRHRRAVELLGEVGITSAARRVKEYPHQFSGGMRQRVMIAIAIANEPDVVIADEPTTALDVTTQAQILRLLARLTTDRGSAVIFITHDLGVVAGFCQRVSVMYAGRIVEQAGVNQTFSRPVHPYSEALLRAVPRPEARRGRRRLTEIGGAPPDLARLPGGCSFEPRCAVGHGNERCLHEAPVPTSLVLAGAPAMAECHFALERAQALESTPQVVAG